MEMFEVMRYWYKTRLSLMYAPPGNAGVFLTNGSSTEVWEKPAIVLKKKKKYIYI